MFGFTHRQSMCLNSQKCHFFCSREKQKLLLTYLYAHQHTDITANIYKYEHPHLLTLGNSLSVVYSSTVTIHFTLFVVPSRVEFVPYNNHLPLCLR